MAKYITVFEAYHLSDLQIIKSAFQSEHIDFHVLDEYTLQNASVAAMGLTGARIQVVPKDKPEAEQLLIDLGFKQVNQPSEELLPFVRKFDRFTEKHPPPK